MPIKHEFVFGGDGYLMSYAGKMVEGDEAEFSFTGGDIDLHLSASELYQHFTSEQSAPAEPTEEEQYDAIPEINPACATCFFFQANTQHGKDSGECRRNPPGINSWPVVETGDWCGEYQQCTAPDVTEEEEINDGLTNQ